MVTVSATLYGQIDYQHEREVQVINCDEPGGGEVIPLSGNLNDHVDRVVIIMMIFIR